MVDPMISTLKSKARSKYVLYMVPESRHAIDIGIKPFEGSFKNLRALADFKIMLDKTWYQHGADIVPKCINPINMCLRPC